MTALSLFVGKGTTITLANASPLQSISGTAGFPATTLVGQATGYGELPQGGSVAAWPSLGAIGAPSGFGALWDVTTLEAQSILAGNWFTTWEGLASVAGITGDLHQRVYKYNGGVYTLINEFIASNKNIGTSLQTKTTSTVSLARVDFVTGDKLYMDTWWNITANTTGNSGTTVSTSYSQSNSSGNPAYGVFPPAYVPTASLLDEIMTRRKWWFL